MSFLLFSGAGPFLRDLLPFPSWLKASLMGVIFMLAYSIFSLPLDYYHSKVLPQRYGLSHAHLFGLWAQDKIKGTGIMVVLAFSGVLVLYLLLGLGSAWWLLAALSFTLLSLILTRITPDFILRLFYRVEPLRDQDLKERLLEICRRAGSRALGVYTLDFSRRGTTANAMLAGQGSTRKILISDTLLKDYPPDEIEVILAHELGHHKLYHTMKLLSSSFLVSLAGFYLVDLGLRAAQNASGVLNIRGLSDPAGLPLIMAIYALFLTLASPLLLAYSRHLEKEADAFSLDISGKVEAFISSQNRLANQNLEKSSPGRLEEILFHDHPPHYKRVQAAMAYKEK